MSKKFLIQKEVEFKHGNVETWYMIKLETTNESGYTSSQFIDCCKDDEEKAHQLFEAAVDKWVPSTKSVIKEVVVE